MIKLKEITLRNFISTGNVTQTLNLSNRNMSLILGENLDDDTNAKRNGVGKSTIINALSYVLFGEPITKIKKDNLINKINSKEMVVTLTFEKNNDSYKIVRGRKPNILKYYVNDSLVKEDDSNETHGESRYTQDEINKILKISPILFKHIVLLNTFTEPFFSLNPSQQNSIIEELFGISLLSEKANNLKENLKETKDNIKEEEYKIKSINDNNEKIQKLINDKKVKFNKWEEKNNKELKELEKSLQELEHIDINKELKDHENLKIYNELNSKIIDLTKSKKEIEKNIVNINNKIKNKEKELDQINSQKCPTCGNDLKNHISLKESFENEIETLFEEIQKDGENIDNISQQLSEAKEYLNRFEIKPEPYYQNISDAYNHRSTYEQIKNLLDRKNNEINPETENIQQLEEHGLQHVSYSKLNDLTEYKNHQEFLLKLLVNKESFIRKKIIDQNLYFLNKQLNKYLEKLSLTHEVVFNSDLSTEISELGKNYDFDNLSRGEKNRLILALSWAFRDLWETLNEKINIMFLDEILDFGLDTHGVENALEILKDFSRTENKDIFLISHRDELLSRVDSVIKVQKQNGFTNFVDE